MIPLQKGFVAVSHGQVHYRCGGRGPVVVMVGEAPRSSSALAEDMEWLGEHFRVIALDLPGCGNSSPLPHAHPSVGDVAAALAEAMGALGVGRCALYGIGFGAQVVLRMTADDPHRAALSILESLPVTTSPGRPIPLPDGFEPEADGSHLPRLWNRMLDELRYTAGEAPSATSRLAAALPDDLGLHERFTDLLFAGPHAARLRAAASGHHVTADIARLASPTVFMCRRDDPRFGDLDRLPAPLPKACSVERIAPQAPAWRTALLSLLQNASLPDAHWRAPRSAAPDDRSIKPQRYVDQVHGQIRVRALGVDSGVPLLVLHDVPGGSASLLPYADLLARDRHVIVPDLPGLGESHPLPYPSLGSYVTALVELLDQLGHRSVDVFAAGLSGCFAVALAAREAGLVRRVALDGLPMVRSRDRKLYARRYCPPIVPDRHGAYLQQAWHQLRSQDSSWPWFDRAAVAARRHDPDLDAHRLESLLADVLRQLPSYGDAARAALEGAVREILAGVRQPVLLFEAAEDVLYAGTRRAARRLSSARVLPRPAGLADRADVLRQFFD